MSSNAQITANQLNSQHSTGPASPEGKAVSALNALKHGIFSESRVLPGEDPAALAALDRDYQREFAPQGPIETALVEILVRTQWQQTRYDRIEALVITKYIADSGKSEDEALAELFMQTKNNPLTRLHQRRETAQRHWFRALKELQRLQKSRQPKPLTISPGLSPEEVGFVPLQLQPTWKKIAPAPQKEANKPAK